MEEQRKKWWKDTRRGELSGFFQPALSVVTTYTVSKQPQPEINLPSLMACPMAQQVLFQTLKKQRDNVSRLRMHTAFCIVVPKTVFSAKSFPFYQVLERFFGFRETCTRIEWIFQWIRIVRFVHGLTTFDFFTSFHEPQWDIALKIGSKK